MWAYANRYDYCNVAITGMTLATFVLHYVMAVSSFITFVLDSPTTLRWLQKHIQLRLDYLSEEHLRHKTMHDDKSKIDPDKDILSVV